MKKLLFALFIFVQPLFAETVEIAAPFGSDWITVVSNAKSADSNPYRPDSGLASRDISLIGATGVIVRAKYDSGQTLSTDPVVAVFGRKNNKWSIVKDVNGSRTSTLSDSVNDTTDGTYLYTDPSDKIDALGANLIRISVVTAAASSGSVTIEVSTY